MSQHVAENIRMLRAHCNWSQEILASEAGVDVRSVQRAEKGEASAETVHAIALALKVTPAVLAVDVDAFVKHMEAELAKYEQVQLAVPATGADVAREMSSWSRTFNSIELDTDEQKDMVAEFQQLVSDYGDIWEDLEPLDKRKAEKELQEYITKLDALGLVAGVGSSVVMIGERSGKNMVLAVYKKDDPKTVALIPKHRL
jgi:transcriptional regulator with XRE-family HTH domain